MKDQTKSANPKTLNTIVDLRNPKLYEYMKSEKTRIKRSTCTRENHAKSIQTNYQLVNPDRPAWLMAWALSGCSEQRLNQEERAERGVEQGYRASIYSARVWRRWDWLDEEFPITDIGLGFLLMTSISLSWIPTQMGFPNHSFTLLGFTNYAMGPDLLCKVNSYLSL